jgi:hypothetical protein
MNTVNFKNASPEQLNFWEYLNTKFAILTVTPLCYQGAWGAPLSVYNANILYFALNVLASVPNTWTGATSVLNLLNEANAVFLSNSGSVPYWDATAAAYKCDYHSSGFNNVYFSRITTLSYSQIYFNGYKLTI